MRSGATAYYSYAGGGGYYNQSIYRIGQDGYLRTSFAGASMEDAYRISFDRTSISVGSSYYGRYSAFPLRCLAS